MSISKSSNVDPGRMFVAAVNSGRKLKDRSLQYPDKDAGIEISSRPLPGHVDFIAGQYIILLR